MKVFELIQSLQALPTDAEICFCGYHDSVDEIEDVAYLVRGEDDFGKITENTWCFRSAE